MDDRPAYRGGRGGHEKASLGHAPRIEAHWVRSVPIAGAECPFTVPVMPVDEAPEPEAPEPEAAGTPAPRRRPAHFVASVVFAVVVLLLGVVWLLLRNVAAMPGAPNVAASASPHKPRLAIVCVEQGPDADA